jgi:membrane protein DedA with SNARE-associated domain
MGSVDSETLIVETPAEPRRPSPRIGIKDVLCVGPIIANTIYYYAGLPLTPLLLGRNPVLLSALRGSIASMVAAGGFARVGRAPLLLALLAPIPITMMTDPFFFWAGRRYGRSLITYLSASDPRWRKRAARGERFFKKYGVWTIVLAPFLPAPSPLFYMAAGEAGMPFVVFIVADLLGSLAYIGLIVAAGWAIGQPAVTVAQAISNYALWVIVAMVVLIVAWSTWSAWRSPRETTRR